MRVGSAPIVGADPVGVNGLEICRNQARENTSSGTPAFPFVFRIAPALLNSLWGLLRASPAPAAYRREEQKEKAWFSQSRSSADGAPCGMIGSVCFDS
jgi:hypothetical protein